VKAGGSAFTFETGTASLMSETDGFAVASEVPPPDPPVANEGGGTAPQEPQTKPRSGFQRQKLKVEALKRRVQELEDSYDGLYSDFEKLEHDYTKLESAFNEVTSLNATLAGELQQLKRQRPPVRYGANLMGL
jgi:hypothetical protein